jgi:sec-independent protein translocase protein TatA
MGTLSIWHILILVVVAVLLFGGRGKISDLMGDVAKGIHSFRKGLNDPDEDRKIADRREDAANKDQTAGH